MTHHPLTDALCSSLFHDGGPVNRGDWVCSEATAFKLVEHARKLEAINADLLAALEDCLGWLDCDEEDKDSTVAQAARIALAKVNP